jgi:replicative DNA helicase
MREKAKRVDRIDSSKLQDEASQFSKPTVERSILSLCLKSMSTFIEVASKVGSEDFLCEDNRAIYVVLCNLGAMGVLGFDLPSVASSCQDLGMLDRIGGYPYLDALFSSEISPLNLGVYIKQILDASLLFKLRKSLIVGAEDVYNSANNQGVSASELLSDVENRILSLSLETLKIDDGVQISDGLEERLKEFESNPTQINGIRSGFSILDRITNGFKPGGLYVLAARPKIGKSVSQMNMASYIAMYEQKSVLYLDTEMSKEEFQTRQLSHISGVPERIILNGLYVNDEKQLKAVYYGLEIMKKIRLYHKYIPGFRMDDVKSIVRKYKAKEGIDILFFDYIKMVEMSENYNETQTLGYLTSSLKDLAGMLGIPCVAACQLNRSSHDKSRVSSDEVADSDRILRYCNLLMALTHKDRKEIEQSGIYSGTHRLQILENRSGSTLYNGIDLIYKAPILTMKEAETQTADSFLEQKNLDDEEKLRVSELGL